MTGVGVRWIEGGGVTAPRGFRAAGVRAGIKPSSTREDVALVAADRRCSAAAVFTTNRVQAAPIAVDREHLADGMAQAVVLNSGNANACTGAAGREDAARMCAVAAAALGIAAADVLVCSTGVIGVPLPMDVVASGIVAAAAGLDAGGAAAAARAIMTTDTVPKACAVEFELEGGAVRVGGMAKGSGMIAPHLATMLAVVTTDASVSAGLLQELLRRVADRSFNCITVDGDMSTNDTVVVLASGAAGAAPVDGDAAAAAALEQGLEAVCRELARMIARDGEGATKLVTVRVGGAADAAAARQVGLAVANSTLVKTALFGRDPNWGRILCAMGYAGVEFAPDAATVALCGVPIFRHGAGFPFDRTALSQAMGAAEVAIDIDLGTGGTGGAEIFTCDLSYDYVRINAEYTT